MNHYTYMVQTPSVAGKCMYIGVRSCEVEPEMDSYMGSSKPLLSWLSKTSGAAVKIVLARWPTRAEAMAHEIFLHDCFDVGPNKSFWNQAKATSTFFDVTGLVRPKQFRDNVSKRMQGRVMSLATKQKLAEANRGRAPSNKGTPLSAEAKAKLSAALTGKPGPNLGRVFSAESRAKNSKAKLENPTNYWQGKTRSDEDRQKFRAARLGKPLTEATKELLREKLTGFVHQTIECPHCGKSGGATAMKRWHFDACKKRETT